ncbi:MAG: IS5 family transposase, partial [Gammaproteobacteria bacterium]
IVVPWTRLLAVIDPVYPKAGNGRRPYELPVMLRIHFMQQWFNYSDAAMEEALHDIPLLRRFAGLDAGTDTLPDETTILNFRHLLQTHRLSARLFAEVNALLAEKGLLLREGTTVDATLIAAPPSTKNQDGQRDPEMSQTKKGNQWYFGMKAHIGVDDSSGLVHTVVGTTAKVSDMSQFGALLHGDEARISADRGYDYPQIHAQLEEKLIEDWVARKAKPGKSLDAWTRGLNHAIARLRAIGEHPFRILKRQFGYTKVRYRGLEKNTAQLVTLFALGNLYQARRALLATG